MDQSPAAYLIDGRELKGEKEYVIISLQGLAKNELSRVIGSVV